MRSLQLRLITRISEYHAYNITNTICHPWTAWKSDSVTKIIVTLLFNDGFEKRKISVEAVYTLFWDIIFLFHIDSLLFPKKKSRSTDPFFLTHPIFAWVYLVTYPITKGDSCSLVCRLPWSFILFVSCKGTSLSLSANVVHCWSLHFVPCRKSQYCASNCINVSR